MSDDDEYMFVPNDVHGRQVLTVGQLRTLLDDSRLPDDTIVVLDDTQGWYVHVGKVAVPSADEDDGANPWSCLTFFPGYEFDPRDL